MELRKIRLKSRAIMQAGVCIQHAGQSMRCVNAFILEFFFIMQHCLKLVTIFAAFQAQGNNHLMALIA